MTSSSFEAFEQADVPRWQRLDEIALALAACATDDDLRQTLAGQLGGLFAFDHASLCVAGGGAWRDVPLAGATPAPEGLCAALVPVLEAGAAGVHAGSGALGAFGSVLVAPYGRGGLALLHRRTNAYNAVDVALAQRLAGHVAAALARIDHLRALAERLEALEIQNQELDAYDYSAAHDLKAPLNIINNYAFLVDEVLEDGDIDEARRYTAEIMTTARGMARLLDQLLLVTRAADENDVPPVTAVEPVLVQVLTQFRQPLADAGISLTVESALPSVRAYPVQLETIFANLIGNAIKYIGETPAPRITIGWEEDGGLARFTVRDNGIGISEAEQARLFRRFSRVGKVEAEGSGLGLAIARRTVERLGGALGVTSAPGAGSTFWFTLPVTRESL